MKHFIAGLRRGLRSPAAGSAVTRLSVEGNLVLSGDPTLNVSGSLLPGVYAIGDYSGTLSGSFRAQYSRRFPRQLRFGKRQPDHTFPGAQPGTLALLGMGAVERLSACGGTSKAG